MGYLCPNRRWKALQPPSLLWLPSPPSLLTFAKGDYGVGLTESHEPLKSREVSPLVIEEEDRDSEQEAFKTSTIAAVGWRRLLVREYEWPHLITSKEMGTDQQGLQHQECVPHTFY